MTHISMPNSSAFFKGQMAAQKGSKAPRTPSASASFEEQLFYRGYMREMKKVQQTNNDVAMFAVA